MKATHDELGELKKALEGGDAPLVERMAHSVKGNLAQLGATALAATAYELERRGKEARLDEGEELLAQLEKGFVNLREALKKEGV